MDESKKEKHLRDEVKKIGGIAFKFVSPGNAGVPDRLILLPGGRAVFVELKASRGELSKMQKLRRKQIRELGFKVECLNSNEEIDRFLREIKDKLIENMWSFSAEEITLVDSGLLALKDKIFIETTTEIKINNLLSKIRDRCSVLNNDD